METSTSANLSVSSPHRHEDQGMETSTSVSLFVSSPNRHEDQGMKTIGFASLETFGLTAKETQDGACSPFHVRPSTSETGAEMGNGDREVSFIGDQLPLPPSVSLSPPYTSVKTRGMKTSTSVNLSVSSPHRHEDQGMKTSTSVSLSVSSPHRHEDQGMKTVGFPSLETLRLTAKETQ